MVGSEAEHVNLLTRVLRAEGHTVRPADDGATALIMVNVEPPDLILLDIFTPGLSSLEICRHLKSAKESRHIPIILLNSAAGMDLTVEGLRLGADDYITTPWCREELLVRVRTQLDLRTLKTGLEHLIAQRTLELTAANEGLRRELAERQRAEAILRESHDRLRSIADDAPVIIWAAGPKQEPEFLNRQASLLTGRTLADLRRNGWRASIHSADLERRDAKYIEALKSQKSFQMEYRLRGDDGEYRDVLSIGVPRIVANAFAGHIGIVIDISALKKIQEQILVARKIESVATLAAGIAHDFNNLVGAILGETDLALAELPARSSSRKNLERITEIAMRASEIVRLLMTYAAHDGGRAAPIDLRALIAGMILPLKASISKKAVVQTELSPDTPPILANPVQIRQVLVNLVTNASEALEDRPGSITIRTGRMCSSFESDQKHSVPSAPGQYARLAVTDTGCGITEETLTKVFDPFYTTKFLGRGLGLAVVHGIVRAHGGVINISSKPGEGSTFEILFPCQGVPVSPATSFETAVCPEAITENAREE